MYKKRLVWFWASVLLFLTLPTQIVQAAATSPSPAARDPMAPAPIFDGHRLATADDVNQPPVVRDDTAVVRPGHSVTVDVLANDTDPDGDALSVIAFTQGIYGSVDCTASGQCTYTHGTGLVGPDSFTYTASDGRGGTGTATVTTRVRGPFNEAPVALNDALTTPVVTPGSVNVLANDFDPDGDPLTVTEFTQGSHGSVECTAAGLCTYTPAAGFIGADTFTYVVSDGRGGTATAAVTATVLGPPNRPPVAADDALTTPVETPGSVDVLANDTDPDGDPLTVTSFTAGSHGSVECTAAGLCIYTPAAGFTGTDTFTYVVSDGRGGTDEAKVTVTVPPPSPPPPAPPTTPPPPPPSPPPPAAPPPPTTPPAPPTTPPAPPTTPPAPPTTPPAPPTTPPAPPTTPPAPPTAPTPPAPPTTTPAIPPTPPSGTAAPTLPSTGSAGWPLFGSGGLLMTVGAWLALRRRRR